ncbi:MAG TPA: HEAT repeat domain-containing protein, partial [Planctomycetaceae bacterium]|nr:HEAT repeat domain-containing protein [Planctomycetaceae bacterium]
AATLEDGPVAAQLIAQLARWPRLESGPLLLGKLVSRDARVRSAAIDALAELRVENAGEAVRNLLDAPEPIVRRAAAAAAGRLMVRAAVEQLLRLTRDADVEVRRASLDSLRQLGEPRAVLLAVEALNDRQTQRAALDCISALGGSREADAVIDLAARDLSVDVLTLAAGMLTKWGRDDGLSEPRRTELERAVAQLHGRSGLFVRWNVRGPLAERDSLEILEQIAKKPQTVPATAIDQHGVRMLFANGLEGRVDLPGKADGANKDEHADRVWLASTDVIIPASAAVQFLGSSADTLHVWLNGKRVYQREKTQAFQPDSDRFDAALDAGANRVVVQVAAARDTAAFHLRFRTKSATAEQEKLVQAALGRSGDIERGRKLFFDAQKLQCSKCHRIGEVGERVGPELTGVGNRFSRIHIVESILEPSRTVAPGFQTIAVELRDGRILTGIKIAETGDSITLGDNQAKLHQLAKSEIEEQKMQTQSTMPEGLVKELSVDQFVDLVTFLTNQKEALRGK